MVICVAFISFSGDRFPLVLKLRIHNIWYNELPKLNQHRHNMFEFSVCAYQISTRICPMFYIYNRAFFLSKVECAFWMRELINIESQMHAHSHMWYSQPQTPQYGRGVAWLKIKRKLLGRNQSTWHIQAIFWYTARVIRLLMYHFAMPRNFAKKCWIARQRDL